MSKRVVLELIENSKGGNDAFRWKHEGFKDDEEVLKFLVATTRAIGKMVMRGVE